MWKELKPPQRILPLGVITVEAQGKFRFGSKDVKTWRLDKYQAVKVMQDDTARDLIAFQLCPEETDRSIRLRHNRTIVDFSARWLIHKLNIEPGRYLARKESGLIVVDLSRKLKPEELEEI